jgi:hypothetical protein
MRARDWNDALLKDHRGSMAIGGGRAGFDTLVSAAERLAGYDCAPAWQGEVRIFRYTDPTTAERPFAFIVNRSDLLFYIRKPGLSRIPGGLAALEERFPDLRKPRPDERTIRITDRHRATGAHAVSVRCRTRRRQRGLSSVLQPGTVPVRHRIASFLGNTDAVRL